MRPRELTLRGFRSYADEVTFDFTGRTLIGIFGPTGGGKSSILDAVAFALYGKTPRVERDTKSLINQRRNELHVSLMFEVDGVVWKAVRSIRRGGQSAHALYRVEEGGDLVVTDRSREMGDQVVEILGLEFDAFTRSVLLAQNQFARFLEAAPAKRSEVLKGVFGFDRLDAMRAVAKRRLDSIGASLQVLAERRASAESDRAALPGKQEALAAAQARSAQLRALREAVGAIDEELREMRAAAAVSEAGLKELDGLADLIPDQGDTDGLLKASDTAEADVAEAEAALGSATAEASAARDRHEAVLDAAGGQAGIDAAADLVGRLDAARTAAESERRRLAEAETARDAAAAAVVVATDTAVEMRATAGAAAATLNEAVEREEVARASLHAAHAADRARSLRSSLVEGEPCPVCEQVVAQVPASGAEGDLEGLDAAVAEAAARAESARDAERAAREALVRIEAEVETARRTESEAEDRARGLVAAVEAADAAVASMAAEVASILGEGDAHEALAALRSGVAEAAEAVRRTAGAETAARAVLDEARAARDAARAGLDSTRSNLNRLAARVGVEVDVGDSAESIDAALRLVRDEWLRRRAEASAAAETATTEVNRIASERVGLLEDAGLGPVDDLVDVATEVDRAAIVLETEVAMIEKRLAELDRLDEGETDLAERAALLERLHADLRPSGFLDYVLAERRRILADLAGNHFEALTAGRYRFTEDADFNIVDLSAAEGMRAPASLSGGETFLASLALALALAEIVGRQGGRLDAFFIDEGFGSLDPEHVDLAMDGIERLVTGGPDRLVVVVSHLDAMRDRIEDLIVLSRHPITDHTVIESGASV